jgi:hypothetical protein
MCKVILASSARGGLWLKLTQMSQTLPPWHHEQESFASGGDAVAGGAVTPQTRADLDTRLTWSGNTWLSHLEQLQTIELS